jgi:ATP-binding cassette subfamily B protein
MTDFELDRVVAGNWQEYKAEFVRMRDMVQWVWRELVSKEGKGMVRRMLFWMCISCGLTVILPLTFGRITDLLTPDAGALRDLLTLLAFYGILMALRQVIRYRQAIIREYLIMMNTRQLDLRTTELFMEKSLGMHISENNYLNEANVKKGYERVLGLQGMLLFEGLEAMLNIILPFCALWVFTLTTGQWPVGSIVLAILGCHLAWTLFLNQRVLKVCLPIDKLWRYLNRYRVERWQRVERVKANAKESVETREIERLFDEALEPDRRFWFWFIKQASYRSLLTDALVFVLLAYCIYEVWHGRMARGSLWFLAAWSSQFSTTLWHIGHIEHQFNFFTPSIMAMKQALTMPRGLETASGAPTVSRSQPFHIRFENVGYHYEHRSEDKDAIPTLESISLAIAPGEKVALIGPSGAGKSTVMKLLLRYMDPTEGRILIDGMDLREIDLGSWLSNVGYVAQQFEVFDGTIRYNLTYGLSEERKREITDDEIWAIMRTLQIDFGDRLVDGLQTRIGFNGIKLSGGQNQRLMIGAAALKQPKFMIIDEATSSLDATTERLVQDGLERVLDQCGALIVTHRLNTVRRICDRFILVDRVEGEGGRIAAVARSFEELAEVSPTFRSLAMDQGIVLR